MAEQDKKAEMKQKIADIKAMITGELSKAMRRPRSSYGGPVRISSGVPMKFPYTFTAKLIQFPWKYYIRNQWIWKYYFIAVIVSIPVFKKISNLSNSKENKAKWAEMQRKEKHKH
ncbi:uncharacterized protein [Atheta coriaria]|uniref:uncharacterized protein n=1 Tax=Dalotia coriaria TaxID=877792 RepID=UPI0031F43B2D